MQLRDGTTVEDPRLGCLAQFDERSRDYPVTAAASRTRPVSVAWAIPDGEPVLDQLTDGCCVGDGITNDLRFNPVPIPGLDQRFAKESIYWNAQRIDQWPGGSYPDADPVYEGTSVLAGVKAAAALGYYTEYRWAFSEKDLAVGLSLGPAIIGIPWTTAMFKPDSRGYLRPSGAIAGRHCVLLTAVTITGGVGTGAGYYTIYNSWGPGWGNNGTARITRFSLGRLLKQQGDACIITGRSTPAPTTP